MSETKQLPNFETGGMLCRLMAERQNGVSDCTDDATTEDLAAVLAALPDEDIGALGGLFQFYEARIREATSRAAKAEGERDEAKNLIPGLFEKLQSEREAHAETRQLFGSALQRLKELGEHSFDLDREASPPSPPPAEVRHIRLCNICIGDPYCESTNGIPDAGACSNCGRRENVCTYPIRVLPPEAMTSDGTGRPPPEETAGKDGRDG